MNKTIKKQAIEKFTEECSDFSNLEIQYNEALRALQKRVTGYCVEETKTTYIRTDKGRTGIKDKTTTVKYFPPDLNAIIFVLANRAPNLWKQKPEEADRISDMTEIPDLSKLSENTLKELAEIS